MRFAQAPESLDAALAYLSGLVAEVRFDCVLNLSPPVRSQSLQRSRGLWGQNDLEAHSGQNIARLSPLNKRLQLTPNSLSQSIRGTVMAADALLQRWRSALSGAAEPLIR